MAHKRLIAMSPGRIVKRMESVQFVQSVWRRQLKSALSRKRQSPVLKCLALHAFHVVMLHPMSFQQLPAASSSFQQLPGTSRAAKFQRRRVQRRAQRRLAPKLTRNHDET